MSAQASEACATDWLREIRATCESKCKVCDSRESHEGCDICDYAHIDACATAAQVASENLASLTTQRDELRGKCLSLQAEVSMSRTALEMQHNDLIARREEIDSLLAEKAESNAAMATMRGALNGWYTLIRYKYCDQFGCSDCVTGEQTLMFSPRCSYRHVVKNVHNILLTPTAGADTLKRIKEQDATSAAIRKALASLVNAIDAMEKAVPDSGSYSVYAAQVSMAKMVLESDAGKATLEYIKELEGKAELLARTRGLLKTALTGAEGARLLCHGCSLTERACNKEACSDYELAVAIDGYLKEELRDA